MSKRTEILDALRTEFNLTGIKKVWRSVKEIENLPESDCPSIYVGFGTALKSPKGDFIDYWELPVILVVYFKVDTDTNNSGKLETEAERLIALYDAITSYPTLQAVGGIEDINLITVTPYVNTGEENKGFLLLEYKLTYLGEQ